MTGFVQSIITIVLFIVILGDPRGHPRARPLRHGPAGQRPGPRVRRRLPAAGQGPAHEGRDALHAQLAADRRLREARGRGRRRRGRPALVLGAALPRRSMLILVAGVADERAARLRDLHRRSPWSATRPLGVEVGGVQPGSPAARPGLVPGDVDRQRRRRSATAPSTGSSPLDDLRANAGETVDARRRARRRRPRRCTVDPPARERDRRRAGRARHRRTCRRSSYGRADPRTTPVEAIQIGAQRTVDALGLIVGGLGDARRVDRRPTRRSRRRSRVRSASRPRSATSSGSSARSSRSTWRASCRPTSRS